MTMTANEITFGMFDKLQDENRMHLRVIKKFERQLADKDRTIKVLEERIRAGTDGILEAANHQKDVTIKHLERQMDELFKKKKDLDVRLEAVKSEICPACERKLLLTENREFAGLSKSYKLPEKSRSVLDKKKSLQTTCPNRDKIIEHKNKRIDCLSKEVQRLEKTEKELNNKIYRLEKLLKMSHLSPNTIIEILLQENQKLESQKRSSTSDVPSFDFLSRTNEPSTSRAFSNKASVSKSTERLKTSRLNLPESEQALDPTKFENEVLHKKLQKLYHDLNEFKRTFEFESEKLSQGLNSAANEYRTLKINLEESINNLNEIVRNILSGGFNDGKRDDLRHESDDNYVIKCLQSRLKEETDKVVDYEHENKMLRENLKELEMQLDDYHQKHGEEIFSSLSGSKRTLNINDVKKLQEDIKEKETQLEIAEKHIKSCEKHIEELQQNRKRCAFDHPKMQQSLSRTDDVTVDNALEKENKKLQIMLDAAEENIKTCEAVSVQLQNSVKQLEEENLKLESELHEVRSKAIPEKCEMNGLSETRTLKKKNQELQDKIKSLEETITRLETEKSLQQSRNIASEDLASEKTRLQSKLDAADNHINALEKSITVLQEKSETISNEKKIIEDQLEEAMQSKDLAETYKNDVMALKNELILKEDENQELNEALRTLEEKTSEMNYFRKSLHQEIENLCKMIMENDSGSEDSQRRKTIYKAAILRSAQALLRLDDNFNLKDDGPDLRSALDEMTHQIQVYLTEVSRIHELLTMKQQEKDRMLKEYFDLDDDAGLKPSSSRHFESPVQGQSVGDNSSPNVNVTKLSDTSTAEKIVKAATVENIRLESVIAAFELQKVQEELAGAKALTNYMMSSNARFEDELNKERTDRAKCEKEKEMFQEMVNELKAQLDSKIDTTKRLNALIDLMRSKEFHDEVSREQLTKEIQYLSNKTSANESELRRYREENCKIKSDLESMKRDLINEKYDKAKTDVELKHLKKILNSHRILDE